MCSNHSGLIRFSKLQSYGNDYVFIQTFTQNIGNPGKLAKFVSDRHFGVGSDGMILLCPSQNADFHMRVFNPDGSEAEMCGNALRSAAMLFFEKGFTARADITVETAGGIKYVHLHLQDSHAVNITADIGAPILDCNRIPTLLSDDSGRCVGMPFSVSGRDFELTAMSFGNPHCAVYCADENVLDLERFGRAIEKAEIFPHCANVEFYNITDRESIHMRTWERNCGETLSCATGACCCVVAGVLAGRLERSVTAHQLGGSLRVLWRDDGNLLVTGKSTIVFDGVLYGAPVEE